MGKTVYIDRNDYYIKEIDQILGILASTLMPEPVWVGANASAGSAVNLSSRQALAFPGMPPDL